ncbi:MAG: NAD(P)-dependent oxidoreductase, partial [Methanomassiliicoccales archaeon]
LKLVEEDAYESYERWINWADLVVAATDDPLLNDKICSYAKSVGKDFNRADGVGSFLIPSVIDKGNFIIAISTFGRSPAVSRALKEELESAIDVNWSLMVELQEEIRKEIKSRVLDQRLREKALRLIIKDKEILRMLGIDYTKAKNLAIEKIEKEMNGLQKREVA